jgi:ubiquinone/menaquinone biosynthesis C-methylase UbiE
MSIARRYDALNAALFLSAGGSRRLRRVFVDRLDVQPEQDVLELGCGTGQVTEALVNRQARVVAIDALDAMIERARRRAPDAEFRRADVLTDELGGPYGRVALSFILHNFDHARRVLLLERARTALGADGRLGVLEWALPSGPVRAAAWGRLLERVEPAGQVRGLLAGGLEAELETSGLHVVSREALAGGRVCLVVASQTPQLRRSPR